MTVAFVQKTAKFSSAGASSINAAALTVTSANALIVTVSTWNAAGAHNVTASSSPSNTWNTDVSAADTGLGKGKASIAAALGCAAGSTTVTITSSVASTAFEGNVSEFSGLLTASALDKTASDPGGAADTTSAPTTAATTQNDELVIGAVCWNSADVTCNISDPPSTGYTSIGVNQDSNATIGYEGAYKIVAATGAQSVTWTGDAVTEGTVGVIATYKAAVTAAFAPMMPVVIWGRNKIRMSRLPSAQSVDAVAVAYVWLPTGGFTLAGTAPYNKGKVYAVSGGLTFAGTAPYNKGRVYAVSGGLVFGGVAVTLYTPAGAVDYVYTPSGGLVFGGTAPYNKGKVFAVSGGLVLGGAAVLLKGKVYAPSGGLVFGGNAVLLKGKVYVVSGGLTFGGIAPYEFSGTVVVAAIHTINSPLNVGTLLNRS